MHWRCWPERWKDRNWTYWGLMSADRRAGGQRITSRLTVLFAGDWKVHGGGVLIIINK